MSSLGWIGVILWGSFMTGIGLLSVSAGVMHEQTVTTLISIGLVTCLIGALGVCGMLSWIPGLHEEAESAG